jgi:F0F1-type ATP synthase membrane subunit c/vacuolar-type H+-ATPase subunit K
MGKLVAVVLIVEAIPVGILVSAALDRSLQRRPRFSLRLSLFLLGIALPDLAVIGGFAVGLIADGAFSLVMAGLIWGLTLLTLAPSLLFAGRGPTPGPPDGGGDDFGPGDGWPPAPRPRGGIPLPDAEQSPVRLRGHAPTRRPVRPRRPAREPGRAPSRLRLLPLERPS